MLRSHEEIYPFILAQTVRCHRIARRLTWKHIGGDSYSANIRVIEEGGVRRQSIRRADAFLARAFGFRSIKAMMDGVNDVALTSDPQLLGRAVFLFRETAGLSRPVLAQKLDGLTRDMIEKVETGGVSHNEAALARLASFFDCLFIEHMGKRALGVAHQRLREKRGLPLEAFAQDSGFTPEAIKDFETHGIADNQMVFRLAAGFGYVSLPMMLDDGRLAVSLPERPIEVFRKAAARAMKHYRTEAGFTLAQLSKRAGINVSPIEEAKFDPLGQRYLTALNALGFGSFGDMVKAYEQLTQGNVREAKPVTGAVTEGLRA